MPDKSNRGAKAADDIELLANNFLALGYSSEELYEMMLIWVVFNAVMDEAPKEMLLEAVSNLYDNTLKMRQAITQKPASA